MIAQIQVIGAATPEASKSMILEKKEEIIRICNEKDPVSLQDGWRSKRCRSQDYRDIRRDHGDSPSFGGIRETLWEPML